MNNQSLIGKYRWATAAAVERSAAATALADAGEPTAGPHPPDAVLADAAQVRGRWMTCRET
jgi:hypothetical protein